MCQHLARRGVDTSVTLPLCALEGELLAATGGLRAVLLAAADDERGRHGDHGPPTRLCCVVAERKGARAGARASHRKLVTA